jgi:hypothetical protein
MLKDTIIFYVNYLGGVDMIYLIGSILAATQLFKMLLDAFGRLDNKAVRPFPYVAGAFLAGIFIDSTARGAMMGVVCGMVASVSYYGALLYLERKAAPAWQIKLAKWLNVG